jgi:hypothetical protein
VSAKIVLNSRLNMGELLSFSGIEFWDTLVLPPIPISVEDIEYEVVAGDRIDVLAYKYYGDPALWWFIAVANDIELCPIAFNEGDKLRIPPASYLSKYVAMVRKD